MLGWWRAGGWQIVKTVIKVLFFYAAGYIFYDLPITSQDGRQNILLLISLSPQGFILVIKSNFMAALLIFINLYHATVLIFTLILSANWYFESNAWCCNTHLPHDFSSSNPPDWIHSILPDNESSTYYVFAYIAKYTAESDSYNPHLLTYCLPAADSGSFLSYMHQTPYFGGWWGGGDVTNRRCETPVSEEIGGRRRANVTGPVGWAPLRISRPRERIQDLAIEVTEDTVRILLRKSDTFNGAAPGGQEGAWSTFSTLLLSLSSRALFWQALDRWLLNEATGHTSCVTT